MNRLLGTSLSTSTQMARTLDFNAFNYPYNCAAFLSQIRNSSTQRRRSLHTSAVNCYSNNTLTELPELKVPEFIPYINRTTAFLTKEDAEKYLYPLYCRGWEVKKMKANDGFNVQDVESPFLVGNMMLKGPKSARTLIKQLLLLEEQEKHDVSFNLWSGKRPTLTIISQTHSARNPEQSSGSNDETAPNITLRDIRIAVLLELYAKEANVLFSSRDLRNPSSWEALLSQYQTN